ncbi:MAG: hypothetical protein AAF351_07555 [Pseudomonadota bacterium]
MIVRRIREHIQRQDWFALALDFVIVVVGVFVGLQAQDWNTNRAERAAEKDALARLITEYQVNLGILDYDRERSVRSEKATNTLIGMISPDPAPVTVNATLNETFSNIFTNPKFVPNLGTTNSLIASGDIRLIRDPEIQRLLTQWPTTAQTMIEWQEIERMHSEELILGYTFNYVAWPDFHHIDSEYSMENFGDVPDSLLESDFNGLLSSKRFEGMLANRRSNLRFSVARIDALKEDTQELIDLMQERLDNL